MQSPRNILVTARTLLAEHGEVRSQPAADWRGSFPLPAELLEFYDVVGPVNVRIEGYGNPYFLPSLAKLWEFQAGYRWNSITKEAIATWSDEWVVVADEGGDAFMFDRGSSNVLFAPHGYGLWKPERRFPDVGTMACCLAILGSVVRAAGADFTDKNFFVKPQHREMAIARVTEILGSRSHAKSIVSGAGWG